MNKCTKCGGTVHYDTTLQLPVDPPKYGGKCEDCGAVYYIKCNYIKCTSVSMKSYEEVLFQAIEDRNRAIEELTKKLKYREAQVQRVLAILESEA